MSLGVYATVRIDTSVLDAIVANMPRRVEAILIETSSKIEADAKIGAPVDTGALRNSIMYERVGDLHYVVHDGVEYGIYNELGTRYMAAHPFFIPAVERNADVLISRIPSVFR